MGVRGLVLAFVLGLAVALGMWGRPRGDVQAVDPARLICVGTGCFNVYLRTGTGRQYLCSYKGTCGQPCQDPSSLPCSGALCADLAAGYPGYEVEEQVVCYAPTPTPPPPPVLTLEFRCDVWGTGGWCRQGGRLWVRGEDPSGGPVQVTGTLGDPGNTPLACQGQGACTVEVPLPEGKGTAQARATSAYGEASGEQPWQYDPTPPELQYRLNPAAPDGANGWYVTAPQVTVTGRDATSGIVALRVSPDGGATWYASPWTVPDGQHTLLVQAVDAAGNITQAQVPVKVDTTPPQ